MSIFFITQFHFYLFCGIISVKKGIHMVLLKVEKILGYIHRRKVVTSKQLTKRFKDIDDYYDILKRDYVIEKTAKEILKKEYMEKKRIPEDEPVFYLSIYGIDIVLKRRREFWGFLLPYAITTIIAITSLIAQFR